MTEQEACGWLGQVGAKVLYHAGKKGSNQAWAAVICTPSSGRRPGKIILSFGASLEIVASRAEKRWHSVWEDISAVH